MRKRMIRRLPNARSVVVLAGHPSRLRPPVTLASQQNTGRYSAKAKSGQCGCSFSFGSMTGSAYIGASIDTKISSRYLLKLVISLKE